MLNQFANTVRSTPTIQAAAYATGDQLGGGSNQLTRVVYGPNGIACLRAIKIIDKAKQKSAMDVLFFNSQPTVSSSENGPYDISDTEAANKFIGLLSIAASDYKDLNVNSVGIVVPVLPIALKALQNTANPEGKSLWYALVCRGAPTYTSTSDLTLVFEFE